VEEEDKVQKGK